MGNFAIISPSTIGRWGAGAPSAASAIGPPPLRILTRAAGEAQEASFTVRRSVRAAEPPRESVKRLEFAVIEISL
jgi:hypothetical protein